MLVHDVHSHHCCQIPSDFFQPDKSNLLRFPHISTTHISHKLQNDENSNTCSHHIRDHTSSPSTLRVLYHHTHTNQQINRQTNPIIILNAIRQCSKGGIKKNEKTSCCAWVSEGRTQGSYKKNQWVSSDFLSINKLIMTYKIEPFQNCLYWHKMSDATFW